MRNDALGLFDHVEAHEGDLHRQDRAQNVERRVRDVQAMRIAA